MNRINRNNTLRTVCARRKRYFRGLEHAGKRYLSRRCWLGSSDFTPDGECRYSERQCALHACAPVWRYWSRAVLSYGNGGYRSHWNDKTHSHTLSTRKCLLYVVFWRIKALRGESPGAQREVFILALICCSRFYSYEAGSFRLLCVSVNH